MKLNPISTNPQAVTAFAAALTCCALTFVTPALAGDDFSDRTPKEVFMHHLETLGARDVNGIVADYTDSSVVVTGEKVYRGKEEIHEFFSTLLAALPDAEWGLHKEIYEANTLYIEWTARSPAHNVNTGVDTFVFEDGMIAVQTAYAPLIRSSLADN